MRRAAAWLAVAALTLSSCAAIESVFKPTSAPSPAGTPAPARVRPAPAPMPPLQPQLTEAEERRLREQARRQIADAERAAQGIRSDALQPPERETLGAIQSFLQQAHQALAARDYERATTLARKAQALAQELPQITR